jgi:hypothetical protein
LGGLHEIVKSIKERKNSMDLGIASIIGAVIAAIGSILAVVIQNRKIQLQKRNNQVLQLQQLRRKPEDQKSGNDIKVISPSDGEKADLTFIVSGTYKIKPYISHLQLFTTTHYGSGYWPQEVAGFDESKNTWHARVNIGGIPIDKPVIIVVALVGPEGQALCNYYNKVGQQTQRWPSIDVLTSDISEVGRITVIRK